MHNGYNEHNRSVTSMFVSTEFDCFSDKENYILLLSQFQKGQQFQGAQEGHETLFLLNR